jgi:hypothetical protein
MIVCTSRFRNASHDFQPGDIIRDQRVIDFLLAASPASFAAYTESTDDLAVSAIEAAPADKAVKRSRKDA